MAAEAAAEGALLGEESGLLDEGRTQARIVRVKPSSRHWRHAGACGLVALSLGTLALLTGRSSTGAHGVGRLRFASALEVKDTADPPSQAHPPPGHPGQTQAPKPAPGAPTPAPGAKCGLLERGLDYVVEHAAWTQQHDHIPAPEQCCQQCQAAAPKCKAWTWVKASKACLLKGGLPSKRPPNYGVISGLPVPPGPNFAAMAPTQPPATTPPHPPSTTPARPSKPPPPPPSAKAPAALKGKAVLRPVKHECGPPEAGKAYVVKTNWTQHLEHVEEAKFCRSKCGALPPCRSWTWIKDGKAKGGVSSGQCILLGGFPTKTQPNDGVVSGECGRRPRAAHVGRAGGEDREEDGPPPDLRAPPEQALADWHPSCAEGVLPALPVANVAGEELQVKLLTYNLYWWNLFDVEKGLQGKPMRLIKDSMGPPYDVMGFQECEDPQYVLQRAGVAGQYHILKGEQAICMAYFKSTWALLASGQANVAEDRRDQYFGRRAAQWIRVRHKRTGKVLFFMNYHGPTPVDSGGYCGGPVTAFHLLQLAANTAHPGDAIILAGDFNAGMVSSTVARLRLRLDELFHGAVDGGVDHIFSNLAAASAVKTLNLGKGGSDHDALEVVVRISGPGARARPQTQLPPPPPMPVQPPPAGKPPGAAAAAAAAAAARPWAVPPQPVAIATAAPPPPSQCRVEQNTDYVIKSSWGYHFDNVPSPDVCCHRCNVVMECKAWIWLPAGGLNQCWLKGGLPVARVAKPGHVAGLPNRVRAAPPPPTPPQAPKVATAAQPAKIGQTAVATGPMSAPVPGNWQEQPDVGNTVMFISKQGAAQTSPTPAQPAVGR